MEDFLSLNSRVAVVFPVFHLISKFDHVILSTDEVCQKNLDKYQHPVSLDHNFLPSQALLRREEKVL
jgi:hypothetical protein